MIDKRNHIFIYTLWNEIFTQKYFVNVYLYTVPYLFWNGACNTAVKRLIEQNRKVIYVILLLCTETTEVLFFSIRVEEPQNIPVTHLSVSLLVSLSVWLSSQGKVTAKVVLYSSRSSRAFQNPLVIVDSFTLLHSVRIHWQTSERDALCMRPVFVNNFSPLVIQASHSPRSAALNARFTLMSSDWKNLVAPPGSSKHTWNAFSRGQLFSP